VTRLYNYAASAAATFYKRIKSKISKVHIVMIRAWIMAACCVFIGSFLVAQTTPVLSELQTFKEKGDAIEENGFFLGGAFSPDGKSIAVSTDRGYLLVWNLADGKKIKTNKIAKGHHIYLRSLFFTPDSKKLAFRKDAKDIAFWNLDLAQEVQVFQFSPSGSSRICLTNDGKFLIASGQGEFTTESKVVIWNLETGAEVRTIKSKKVIADIAVSPDGTKLACACTGGVPIFEMATGEELDRFEEKLSVRTAAFSPDGKILAFTTTPNNTSCAITLLDMATKKSVGQLTGLPSGITQAVFSPDGTLMGARTDRSFYVCHIASNRQSNIEMRDLGNIAFSVDSKMLLAVGKVDKKPCAVLWKIELK
jgi:WD40 repeat protein